MNLCQSNNHFWDSCVLIRHITGNPEELLRDMSKLLDEARAGKRHIWYSTILYAEFRPSLLSSSNEFSSIEQLIADIEGVMHPVGPNPVILQRAGRIRDYQFYRPDGVRYETEKKRVMTVPDSIHLASCLWVKEALGVSDIEFHTFDDGKGKNYEDKAVSLLRLEEYAEHIEDSDIDAVKRLVRIKPQLAQGELI